MNQTPLTPTGFTRLEAELKNLKSVERPNVIQAIAEARAQGDLSENAEYEAAREKQSFIEGRILELEALVSSAEVIDSSKFGTDQVRFGAFVTVVDDETDKESKYQIVGVPEADITQGRISISSPIARVLMGKKIGDEVTVSAPKGDKSYEILAISYE